MRFRIAQPGTEKSVGYDHFMRTINLILLTVLAFSCSAVSAQTVVITPKKTIHRRPKPEVAFKRTFTIRRPIAKASTAALSQKITTAISPEKVLELNTKEEMGEYQWLTEADYKLLFNQNGVLCLEEWMSGVGPYPDTVTKRVVIDIEKGTVVKPEDVFQDLSAFAKLVKKTQKLEVAAAAKRMKADPDAQAIMQLSVTSDTLSRDALTALVEDNISERLAAVQGVADVQIYGTQDKVFEIDVDPASVPAERKADVLRALDERARSAAAEVAQVSAS